MGRHLFLRVGLCDVVEKRQLHGRQVKVRAVSPLSARADGVSEAKDDGVGVLCGFHGGRDVVLAAVINAHALDIRNLPSQGVLNASLCAGRLGWGTR